MGQFDTALNIVSDAAILCGLDAVSDVYGSTAKDVVLLRTLLKSLGRKLALRRPWRQLTRETTFTTDGSGSYALPTDFAWMIDQSGWSRSLQWPLLGPASPQVWQYMRATGLNSTLGIIFRPATSTLSVLPTTDASGQNVYYEYASRNWVATTGTTTPAKDAPTDNTDVLLLEASMLTEGLRLSYNAQKGFDTSAALAEFEELYGLAEVTGTGAAPVLSWLPGYESPLIDERNAPTTGFGLDGDGGGLL